MITVPAYKKKCVLFLEKNVTRFSRTHFLHFTDTPPKNGEIALWSATNRWYVVKCVSQKCSWDVMKLLVSRALQATSRCRTRFPTFNDLPSDRRPNWHVRFCGAHGPRPGAHSASSRKTSIGLFHELASKLANIDLRYSLCRSAGAGSIVSHSLKQAWRTRLHSGRARQARSAKVKTLKSQFTPKLTISNVELTLRILPK